MQWPALVCLPTEISVVTSTPVLPSLGEEQLRIPEVSVRDYPCSSSVMVAEGIPPLPQKTVLIRYKMRVRGFGNSTIK